MHHFLFTTKLFQGLHDFRANRLINFFQVSLKGKLGCFAPAPARYTIPGCMLQPYAGFTLLVLICPAEKTEGNHIHYDCNAINGRDSNNLAFVSLHPDYEQGCHVER